MENLSQQQDSLVLLSPNNVAKRLDVSVAFVKRSCREGEIPSVRIGKFRRIPEASLNEYIATLKNGNGKGHISEDTKNKMRYHAKLKSEDSTTTLIQLMTDRISKMKNEIRELENRNVKRAKVAKYMSIVAAREASKKKMVGMSEEFEELRDQAYPGMEEYIDMDPDVLEEIGIQEAQGEPQTMEDFSDAQLEEGVEDRRPNAQQTTADSEGSN
ncbi:MAG: hypothetical protein CML07_01245 [Psychrobacter sp.]|nr:hypothetical protein [Psychrobacter sp.]